MTAKFTVLGNTTLTSASQTVTFSSIPAVHKDLTLAIEGIPSTAADLQLNFNGDVGNNYFYVILEGNVAVGARSAAANPPNISLAYVTGKFSANVDIMDYSSTDKEKSTLSRAGDLDRVNVTLGRRANTAAITSMVIKISTGTFNAGSTFKLLGVN